LRKCATGGNPFACRCNRTQIIYRH
jgi:hypothetical protein